MDHTSHEVLTYPWTKPDQEGLLKRLEKPAGPIGVLLDTDTYNEVDDQFALSYLIKSEGDIHVRAICAAPFFNERSAGPADGMEKSYQEILTLLTLLGREDLKPRVFRGSQRYLPSEAEPVLSDAAGEIVRLAMEHTPERPLYIVAIGAITNVASALLLEPAIRDRIVIVWLGGHGWHWPKNDEFNLIQDVAAARVVFSCGAAVVQLPCMGVVDRFTVSKADLELCLLGRNPLCTYLVDTVKNDMDRPDALPHWSRVIWDVTAVAWLTDPVKTPGEGAFLSDTLAPGRLPTYDGHWSPETCHPVRYVYEVRRDRLFCDLVEKLTQ